MYKQYCNDLCSMQVGFCRISVLFCPFCNKMFLSSCPNSKNRTFMRLMKQRILTSVSKLYPEENLSLI